MAEIQNTWDENYMSTFMTKVKLIDRCREHKIRGYSRKCKSILVDMLVSFKETQEPSFGSTDNVYTWSLSYMMRFTKAHLITRCKKCDIHGYSKLKKREIIDKLIDFYTSKNTGSDVVNELSIIKSTVKNAVKNTVKNTVKPKIELVIMYDNPLFVGKKPVQEGVLPLSNHTRDNVTCDISSISHTSTSSLCIPQTFQAKEDETHGITDTVIIWDIRYIIRLIKPHLFTRSIECDSHADLTLNKRDIIAKLSDFYTPKSTGSDAANEASNMTLVTHKSDLDCMYNDPSFITKRLYQEGVLPLLNRNTNVKYNMTCDISSILDTLCSSSCVTQTFQVKEYINHDITRHNTTAYIRVVFDPGIKS